MILRCNPLAFAGDGHAFEPGAIDCDAQPGAAERRGPAAPAEGQVFDCQSLGDKQSIEAAFEVADAGDRCREMSPGRRENSRLSALPAQLVPETGALRDGGDSQGRNEPATLR